MAIDLARVRAETPGVRHVAHFHHCGASLMPRSVIEAMKQHLDLEGDVGGYEAADQAAERVEATYRAVASLLNAATDEIALVENATVGWDQAFYGLAQEFQPGDRVLVSTAEYASNYIALLQTRRRRGIEIGVVPEDDAGQIDVAALDAMIDDRVKLIALTHAPTGNGLVNPAAAVGAVARRHGIPFLLDACQTAGQMPLDVTELGCDFLAATGRKFLRGPRGTGFLYIRRSMLERFEPPVLDLRSATWTSATEYTADSTARRAESWESDVAARIGLGVAVQYALALGLDAIRERIVHLSVSLRERLDAIEGLTVSDVGEVRSGIVSFTHDHLPPTLIARRLHERGFNVGTSTVRSTRLMMEPRGQKAVVRCATHYFNSETELDRLVLQLETLVRDPA